MNKIYLLGLPGAGKSTTGKWLASKLGWGFVDLDELIEKKAGKSVSDIFQNDGENAFRKMESEALTETFALSHFVIGCGGGTPAFEDNMERMSRHGLTVFLNTEIEEIENRLREQTGRPLFEDESKEGIRRKLEKLAENRRPYYSRAKIIWNKNKPEESFYTSISRLMSLYPSLS
jgi:shikimate kinase